MMVAILYSTILSSAIFDLAILLKTLNQLIQSAS